MVEIALRVPGPWTSPDAFARALPNGYRLGGDGEQLWLYTPSARPDGEPDRVQLFVHPFDDQFVDVFAGGVGRLPSEADRAGIEAHQALICPVFPGGTPELAAAAVRHTAALIRAGGFGVFVDNSGLAHGSDDWLALAGDADGPDCGGPFWAFVTVYGSPSELWSIGMHIFSRRDASLVGRSGDDRLDDFTLRNFLTYELRSGEEVVDGAHLSDTTAGQSLVVSIHDRRPGEHEIPDGHPMLNPFGHYQLNRLHNLGPNAPIAQGPA